MLKNSSVKQILLSRKAMLQVLMFVGGFNIEVSLQSTVEEHYFDIKERDFVVREGTGKLDCRMQVV